MKVLIACEFSGTVRDAFTALGHDAISCDLLPSDKPGKHYQGDVFDIINDGFDLMIAHPPCTWLCQAMRTNAARKDRPEITKNFEKNRELGKKFFLNLLNCDIQKVAVENPIGYMNGNFRTPDQIIRPFMFGHHYSKDVCLWLKQLPPLLPTAWMLPTYKKLDFGSKYRNPNGRSIKSITFQGIANAMALQWGGYIRAQSTATASNDTAIQSDCVRTVKGKGEQTDATQSV
jgi:hypothetical protein